MTPQELDARLEQLATQGDSADVLAALMLSENVSPDRATKIANDWVNYIRHKSPVTLKGPENFFQIEVERLREMLNNKCSLLWNDDDISVTVEEWTNNQEERAMRFLVEKGETMSKLKIGTRVQAPGYGNPNVIVQYGV